MTAGGLVLMLAGVVVVAQVMRGGALQRLGLVSCPDTKKNGKASTTSSSSTTSGPASGAA